MTILTHLAAFAAGAAVAAGALYIAAALFFGRYW